MSVGPPKPMSRILDADLGRPVILDADGTLLDGAHRACKALLLHEKTIAVVRFATTPPPSLVEPIARPTFVDPARHARRRMRARRQSRPAISTL